MTADVYEGSFSHRAVKALIHTIRQYIFVKHFDIRTKVAISTSIVLYVYFRFCVMVCRTQPVKELCQVWENYPDDS